MHLGHLFKQKGYEHIVFVLRRHPIILFKDIVVFIVMAALPLGVLFLLQAAQPTVLSGSVTFPLVAIGGAIYYLAIWLFFFTAILDYYLDIWIVTNDRILAIEQDGLFARTVSELDLWQVQDVTSEVKGAAPTLLNYGQVFIQTAGQKERFVFEQIPDPHHIRQRVLDLAEEDRKFHPAGIVTLAKPE